MLIYRFKFLLTSKKMEDSLASLHVRSAIPGLDIGQVEDERKDMWSNLFKKFEGLGQQEDNVDFSLDDLENIDKLSKMFKDARGTLLQPNSTLKRYIRDHAEEIDEIATIAGPPLSDEEVLSDDSDEELLADDDEQTDSTIDIEVEITDSNSGKSDSDDKETLSENDFTIVDTDDDEGFFYTPDTRIQSRSILRKQSKKSNGQEPAIKKQRLLSSSCNNGMSTITSENNNADAMYCSENLGESNVKCNAITVKNLVCCKCKTESLYEALEVEKAQFVCDECMVGDHMECEVDECQVCKEVGEFVRFRRKAEVLARVQKKIESMGDSV